jgi:hypothetical protein
MTQNVTMCTMSVTIHALFCACRTCCHVNADEHDPHWAPTDYARTALRRYHSNRGKPQRRSRRLHIPLNRRDAVSGD